MRLEHVCDMELVYCEEPIYSGMFLLVRPYGGEEAIGYGEGDGTVTGSKLCGTVRWVNHPYRRNDRTLVPDAHGVIVTDDDAMILFTLQGRAFFEHDTGQPVLATSFEADDARYMWLNTTLCILEGVINTERKHMRARIYACIHDLG